MRYISREIGLRVYRTWRLWIEPERLKMKRDVAAWIRDTPKGSVVVEVGAGTEFMKSTLERYLPDVKYFGGDLAPTTNTRAVFDVCAIPLGDESADVVLALEVLEHIDTPERAVAEISRILKPGGILILTVPFMFGIHDFKDYQRFTPLGLEQLLASTDLSLTEVKTRGGTFVASTGLVRNLILNSIVGKPRDWRAQGRSKKLRWIMATLILTPWTPITWLAYALDFLLDRHTVSAPGLFFRIRRNGSTPSIQHDASRVAMAHSTDWSRELLRCPVDKEHLLDIMDDPSHPKLECETCLRRFRVENGVPILLVSEAEGSSDGTRAH